MISMDFKTQELNGWPQIVKLEVLRQILHYGVKHGTIWASKHDIVNKDSHEHLDIVFEQGIKFVLVVFILPQLFN